MKYWLASLVLFTLLAPASAQIPCGIAGVTATVSPASAAPGQLVLVTLTNGSSQTIKLTSSCDYEGVFTGTTCSGTPVDCPVCLAVIVPIAPGQSYSSGWNQTDCNGQQVPSGTYSFRVSYQDSSFANVYTCCPTLTICASTASATLRNGSGLNPLTLSSVAPPVLGGTWRVDLDCTGHAPANAGLFVLDTPATGPVIPLGELLVTGNRLLRIIQLHSGSVTSFSALVPNDLALCGLQGHAQGVCLGAPGGRLSNALDLVLGT